MKFMQTLDILLFKRSISNGQFWYFFKFFLYQLYLEIQPNSYIFKIIKYPICLKIGYLSVQIRLRIARGISVSIIKNPAQNY